MGLILATYAEVCADWATGCLATSPDLLLALCLYLSVPCVVRLAGLEYAIACQWKLGVHELIVFRTRTCLFVHLASPNDFGQDSDLAVELIPFLLGARCFAGDFSQTFALK